MMDLHRRGRVSARVTNFVLVARPGSIKAAAKSLNVALSSVSRTIEQLAEDLGPRCKNTPVSARN
ncbi:MAG: LysR family transcriptional regulator [Candidatus Saccharibacteria bacterium]|nr:LysR family transcriptional regulator [Pseudorhodobacter sp.]